VAGRGEAGRRVGAWRFCLAQRDKSAIRAIQTLLEHGLIDEFRLKVFPLVLGTGKRLFDGGTAPAGLELASSQVLSSGVIVANYRTGAEIEYGSFAA
jgi:hypothetical protein